MSLPNPSEKSCFEKLPDETLLLICRYLSPVHVLDSLLNLNNRLNQTITIYRRKIFLSHLSYKDFNHLLENYLPYLANHVYSLYLSNYSMFNAGKIFEEKFRKIDQEFPLLNQLIFHQIDIETLENLSWRFNTMSCLRELIIDISNDRLLSMPTQFDEFICGKLFSSSNSFEYLKISFDKYYFNLNSIKRECPNLRQLTISIKSLHDLFILFNYLPNIEKLNLNLSCSQLYDITNDIYPYEQLWWKVPSLTNFILNIEDDELTSHDKVISNEIIIKIIKNIYSLVYLKFLLNIKFSSTLQLKTTKEIYFNKYFPYVDGNLWAYALERNDKRNIAFEFYIELDGMSNNPRERATSLNDDINFKSQIKSTFSSAYWLQKNVSIQCFSSTSKHVSIYTLPITNSDRSTTTDIIDQEISIKSLLPHKNIHNLSIVSTLNSCSSSLLSLKDLVRQYPRLTNLKIDTKFHLPPTITICSNRLHSLTVRDYSLTSCRQLLEYLPQVKSLSIINSSDVKFNLSLKPFLSLNRLKLPIDQLCKDNNIAIHEYFPNLNEFYLKILNRATQSSDDYTNLENLARGFPYLRYLEVTVPIEKDPDLTKWINKSTSNQIKRIKTSDGHYLILKHWI